MRVLFAFTVAVACALPAAAQRADLPAFGALKRTAPSRCAPGAAVADTTVPRAPSMKLGDQPPASHFLAVYTVVDGCPQPVVLRKGIGANPRNAVPVPRTPPRRSNAD